MTIGTPTRVMAALLTMALAGAGGAAGAQDDGGTNGGDEYGVGLYLGACDSLEAGAARFDLGNAELATEALGDDGEDAEGDGGDSADGGDLESQPEEESGGDETSAEDALAGGGEGNGGNNSAANAGDESGGADGGSLEAQLEGNGNGNGNDNNGDNTTGGDDQDVVVQDDSRAVYVSRGASFDASLDELVQSPFAVAVRQSANDDTSGEGNDEFVACGEFGGAVSGDEIVIPLDSHGGGGLSGFAVLSADGGQGSASVYLAGDAGAGNNNEGSNDEGSNNDNEGNNDEGNNSNEDNNDEGNIDADATATVEGEGNVDAGADDAAAAGEDEGDTDAEGEATADAPVSETAATIAAGGEVTVDGTETPASGT